MPPYALSLESVHARACARVGGVRVCVRERRGVCNIDWKAEAPNLLRAENEDCAVNSDPKTHVRQGLVSNWPTSEAVEPRGGQTEPL